MTSTVSLSRFINLGINANTISPYKPFSELNDKYRKQVVFASDIIEFPKGDTVFKGKIDHNRYYFLLKGKLAFKTGMLSKKTIDSQDPAAKFEIGTLLPDGVDVVAAEAGHMLSVEKSLMDTALAWMQAGTEEATTENKNTSQRSDVVANIEEETDEDENDWMSALLASPLFFNLPPANISRVFSLFERVSLHKGDVVISQGEEGHDFYALIHGKANVVVDGNTDAPIAQLSSGAYFGEDALVSGTPRSATVIMVSDGEVGKLDRENFQSLLQDPVVKFISQEDLGQQLMKRGNRCVLLDVRSAEEFLHAPSPNSRNIPCRDLRANIPGLDQNVTYFISQEGGKRSELAAHLLSQANLKAFVIKNL